MALSYVSKEPANSGPPRRRLALGGVQGDTAEIRNVRSLWGQNHSLYTLLDVKILDWPLHDVVVMAGNGFPYVMHGDRSMLLEKCETEQELPYGLLDPGFGVVTHVTVTSPTSNRSGGSVGLAHIRGSYYGIYTDLDECIPVLSLTENPVVHYTHWQDSDGTRMGPTSLGVAMIHFGHKGLSVGHTVFNRSDEVSVFDTDTGETLSKHKVAGRPTGIFPAMAPGWCFITASSGVITVFDYVNARIVGVMRQRPPAGAEEIHWGWHGDRQQLLRYVRTENDEWSDGYIEYYWPTPVPVALQKPIPLRAPRPNRRVPFLTRAFGDTGEGVISDIKWQGQVWSSELDEEGEVVGWQEMAFSPGENHEAAFNQAITKLTQDQAGADAEVTVQASRPFHPDLDG